MPSVLIVDDLVSIHEMLEAVIQPTGFATSFATDGEKALVSYKADKYDLVLADIDMKPMDGITLLKQLKLYDPNAVVIIMTAYASTESAVQALKFGAFDYLQKPFRVDELIATLRRGLEFRKFQAERSATGHAPGAKAEDIESRLIGRSAKVKKLIQQVRKLATVRTPVLLIGENGTGKGSVAEILHAVTGAPEASFVRVDCTLCSEANFREGLLGEKGEGGAWVKQAKGGTLFLEHLQCLTLSVQKELVSVLRNTAHGFRLICTTNEDLEKLVDEGKFHDELFYRVASLPLHMPPLRERSPAAREALFVAGREPALRCQPHRVHRRRDVGDVRLPLAGQSHGALPNRLEDRRHHGAARDHLAAAPAAPPRLEAVARAGRLSRRSGETIHRHGRARLPRRQGRSGQGARRGRGQAGLAPRGAGAPHPLAGSHARHDFPRRRRIVFGRAAFPLAERFRALNPRRNLRSCPNALT